ncbi:hypothetical protein ATANTOWER_006842 [Ataeniobius toweri]|uniref:Uncharacterized protein n=1 Tax=Ataeniobius toweri TaxID=208326 RepID=A0ABU7CF25_9TELE|nr:hypothetical protein [Ataeniobius toweri]
MAVMSCVKTSNSNRGSDTATERFGKGSSPCKAGHVCVRQNSTIRQNKFCRWHHINRKGGGVSAGWEQTAKTRDLTLQIERIDNSNLASRRKSGRRRQIVHCVETNHLESANEGRLTF